MSRVPDRKSALRGFILGTSDEDAQRALDQELAADGSVIEELQVAEADLLDAYAASELGAIERAAVEEIYPATSSGRRRLAFARALRRRAGGDAGTRRGAPNRAFLAAALVVVAVGGAMLAWQNHRLRRDIVGLRMVQQEWKRQGALLEKQVEESRIEITRLSEALETAVGSSQAAGLPEAGAVIARLVLRSGHFREAGAMPTLELTPRAEWVELEVPLPVERHPTYRLVIETPEGKLVWKSNPIGAPAPRTASGLVVRVPARILDAGTAIATLSGCSTSGVEEPLANYTFRVRRPR
ncbi:MAG: hypothetical protein AB1714_31500 [Acidobacteriota bacterium]